MMTVDEMPILLRREVEARMIKPFLDAFTREIGRERTLEIAGEVIDQIAYEQGKARAEQLGKNGLEDCIELLALHETEGGCDNVVRELTDDHVKFDTMDCEYVRMYKRLGMEDLGFLLSCRRDYKWFEGVNDHMRLVRKSTRMIGADRCDFCVKMLKDEDLKKESKNE